MRQPGWTERVRVPAFDHDHGARDAVQIAGRQDERQRIAAAVEVRIDHVKVGFFIFGGAGRRNVFALCRTKKPCNSKYSRTIVSLTAAIPIQDSRL